MALQKQTPAPDNIRFSEREQVQYLLGNPPSWMMSYGISVMAGFGVLMLVLSYSLWYPDVIEAKITLTTANMPIRVMASSSGRISDLLVSDHQAVEQGVLFPPRQVFLPPTTPSLAPPQCLRPAARVQHDDPFFLKLSFHPAFLLRHVRSCSHPITLLCASRSEPLLRRCAWHC
jgi:hypothetical protein